MVVADETGSEVGETTVEIAEILGIEGLVEEFVDDR